MRARQRSAVWGQCGRAICPNELALITRLGCPVTGNSRQSCTILSTRLGWPRHRVWFWRVCPPSATFRRPFPPTPQTSGGKGPALAASAGLRRSRSGRGEHFDAVSVATGARDARCAPGRAEVACQRTLRSPYPASNSLILSSRNFTSAGFSPGPPAKCPQIDGIGTSSAFGMFATSISLSATGK